MTWQQQLTDLHAIAVIGAVLVSSLLVVTGSTMLAKDLILVTLGYVFGVVSARSAVSTLSTSTSTVRSFSAAIAAVKRRFSSTGRPDPVESLRDDYEPESFDKFAENLGKTLEFLEK